MQRVAIARAIINNPDILLCDEPTGALDSDTSKEIMELIKKISKDKFVIMVTHNEELAKKYATRIINLKDGRIIKDTDKLDLDEETNNFKINKTSMNFIEAIKLSFNNLKTKKGRTFLTAFASSIGIIGIALILALSNGFNIQIDNFENDTLSTLPIIISKEAIDLNQETLTNVQEMVIGSNNDLESYPSNDKIYSYNISEQLNVHYNNINNEYIKYINKLDFKYYTGITLGKTPYMHMIIKNNDSYKEIDLSDNFFPLPSSQSKKSSQSEKNKNNFVNNLFDVIYGRFPENKNELLLIVDSKNRVDSDILNKLGFTNKVTFKDIINKEIKLVFNNNYYKEHDNIFIPNNDLENVYNNPSNLTLKIVGIIRGKKDKYNVVGNDMGISYTEELSNYVIDINKNSDIVKKQKSINYNILTGAIYKNNYDKEITLNYLGDDSLPSYIYIYPKDFESKKYITDYLDNYNKNKDIADKIIYIDQGELIVNLSSSIMGAITIILIAFSAVSLIVSSIMIGIITYISVLERTKEIGILKSLGARKKDITRVFTAEVFIIGLISGILGLLLAKLLSLPLNIIIESFTSLSNVCKFNISHMIILLAISISLTLIGGIIPSILASRKNPVDALRCDN